MIFGKGQRLADEKCAMSEAFKDCTWGILPSLVIISLTIVTKVKQWFVND